jgi:hypothetical protein
VKTTLLTLKQLPDTFSELYQIIVSTYPEWAGSEPLTFSKGGNSRSLRVEIPCQGCGKEMKRLASDIRKMHLRTGWGWTCSKACMGKKRQINRICKLCGCTFKGTKDQKSPSNCGPQCPGRGEQIVTFSAFPTSVEQLTQIVAEQKPVWVRKGKIVQRSLSATLILRFPCVNCGEAIDRLPGQTLALIKKGHKTALCSLKCNGETRHVPCETCGKRSHLPEDGPRRWCSKECIPPELRPYRLPMFKCPVCRTDFQPNRIRAVHCSRACADIAHSKRMTGGGNSHFKHGTSYTLRFTLMRPLIMERDGYVCVVCKKQKRSANGNAMPIHHIDHNPQNNSPQNLILLCHGCHSIHHFSIPTPFPWFAGYAALATLSMTSKWREECTFLQKKYSPTLV